MQENFFYHSSIRSYIVSFLNVFNSIQVTHGNGNVSTVPIKFTPKEKFIEEYLDGNRKGCPSVEKVLPAFSVDMGSPLYDSSRKTNTLHKNIQLNNGQYQSQLNPVPYNFDFTLNVWTRYGDEMFQIIEQILPFFQPSYNITIKEMPDMGITERDIPIVLNGVNIQTEYVGDRGERRRLESELTFTLKGWLYPDIKNTTGLIKRVLVDFADYDSQVPLEHIMFSADPLTSDPVTWDDTFLNGSGYYDPFDGVNGDEINGAWNDTFLNSDFGFPRAILEDGKAVTPMSNSPLVEQCIMAAPISAASPHDVFVEAECNLPIDPSVGLPEPVIIIGARFHDGSIAPNFSGYAMILDQSGSVVITWYKSIGEAFTIWKFSDGTYTDGDLIRMEIFGNSASTSGSPSNEGTIKIFLNNVLLKELPTEGAADDQPSPPFSGAIDPDDLPSNNQFLTLLQRDAKLISYRCGVLNG